MIQVEEINGPFNDNDFENSQNGKIIILKNQIQQ